MCAFPPGPHPRPLATGTAPSDSYGAAASGGDGTVPPPRRVRLEAVLAGVDFREVHGDVKRDITGVTHNSAAVTPGALFCCLRGANADGHDYAPDAVEAGAVALLCERRLPLPVTQVIVPDGRAAIGPIAAAFFGHPSSRMAVVGVTGTNGKTTTTHLLRAALHAGGYRAEVIGTLSGARTTPEAPELQSQLAGLLAEGINAVVMEVSSHALAQRRVDATHFRVAVFTNLSQDHLDFHGSMEQYFQAKAALFSPARAEVAVINADDPYGRRLLDANPVPARSFSLADAADLEVGVTATTFRWQGHAIRLQLGGVFNVTNALAAATTARELGLDPAVIADGLSSAGPVPGRFEPIDAGQPFTVLVDYAHTPAGLEHVLETVRALTPGGRVLVVFGCGGDRDRAKRPLMGDVASRFADVAIVTSDNPRSEDPLAIIDDVRRGEREPGTLVVEPDRRAAIALAVNRARPGDVVVIAGKGHERIQDLGSVRIEFDDRQVARQELERLIR